MFEDGVLGYLGSTTGLVGIGVVLLFGTKSGRKLFRSAAVSVVSAAMSLADEAKTTTESIKTSMQDIVNEAKTGSLDIVTPGAVD